MSFVVDSKGGCFLCLRECGTGSRSGGGGGGASSSPSTILSLKLLTRVLGLDIRAVLKSSIDPLYLSQSVRNGEIGVRACGDCSEITGAFSELVAQLERVRLEVAASVARIEGVMLGSERDSQLVREYNRRVVSNSASPQDIIVSNMCEKLRKEVVLRCSKFSKGTFPRVELQRLEGGHHHHHPSDQRQPPPLQGCGASETEVIDEPSTSTKAANNNKSGNIAENEEEEEIIVEKVIPRETTISAPTTTAVIPGPSSSSLLNSETRTARKGSFICTFCPQVFDTPDGIRAHIYVAHKTQVLLAHKEPGTSVELFDRLVEELFEGISLPQEPDGSYACAFCDKMRQGSLSQVYSHLIPSHMEELARRLKSLQEDPLGPRPPSPTPILKSGGKHIGRTREPFSCQICGDKSYVRSFTLKEHKLMEHRSSYFTEFKDPRLSAEQFEKVIRRLFVRLLWKEVGGLYRCTLCDGSQGQHSKSPSLVWHYILDHMEELLPKLEELQEKEAAPKEITRPVATVAHDAPFRTLVASSSKGHHVRFISLKSGKYKCSLCSKTVSGSWSKASHIMTHTGQRPYPCHLCKDKAFTQQKTLKDHNLLEHRSAYFAQWQDPRLTAEQFETAVRRLFVGLIPQRVNGIYSCALCEDDDGLGAHSRRPKLIGHYIRDHMGQLLPKLEKLQDDLAMAPPPSSSSLLKCPLCTKSASSAVTLEDHTFSCHRSTLFIQHKDERLSSAQFERVLCRLFDDLKTVPQSAAPPEERRHYYACPFCPDDGVGGFRHRLKVRVYSHIVREHMGLLAPTLAELQSEVAAAEGRGGEQQNLLSGATAETKAEADDDHDPLETKIGFAKLSNGKYRCRLCSKTVPAHDKNRHRLSHETHFKCAHCPKSFQTGATLEHHVYRSHLCSFFAQHKDPKLSWTDFKVLVAQLLSSVTVEDSATRSSSCSFCSDSEGSSRFMVHRHMLKEHMAQLVPLLTERQEESLTLLATTGCPFRDMRPRRIMRLHPYDRERPVTTERAMEDAVELVAGGGGVGGCQQKGAETTCASTKKQVRRTREFEMDETRSTTVVTAEEPEDECSSSLPTSTYVLSQGEEEVEDMAITRHGSDHHHHQVDEGMKVEEEEGEEEEEPSASTLLDDINSILGI